MLFTELRFIPFFLLVFSVYWLIRRDAWRKVWLLLASYAFYAAWNWYFLFLILISTIVDYVAGLMIARPGSSRRLWLFASVATNLTLLGFFKYFNFFVASAVDFLGLLGFRADVGTLEIVLPVGISFFTFQTMSYSLDIYFGRLKPTRKLLDLALFVAFFPQLVAGPIVRAVDFLPQLLHARQLARVEVRAALVLFLTGFIKKACVSDNLSPVVDRYFESPEVFDALTAWLCTLAYAVQIYCDFSGYSDMAIACAALLGYRLCVNFDFPYFAASLADFWRRWHISLSSWLRDYLYIPLGGGRGSRWFRYRNLMITMLLGGLWHGAAWNFVIWGCLHGLGLIVHRVWTERIRLRLGPLRFVSILVTFYFVCLAWIFFRAVGLEDAVSAARAFVLFDAPGTEVAGRPLAWILPALAAVHWLASSKRLPAVWRRGPDWAFAAGCGVCFAVTLTFVSIDFVPFIYFQF